MARKTSLLALVVVVSLLATDVSAEERTWTSDDGLFTFKAEMIRLNGETIHLKLADNGKEIAVKLSEFSPKDQEYAKLAASKKTGSPASTPVVPKKLVISKKSLDAIDFNKVPRLDYATLLRMYYAAHKDILIKDQGFLLEVYAVFVAPQIDHVPFKANYMKQLVNPKEVDEFSRPRYTKEFTDKARAFLEKSPEWPKTGLFRLHWLLELNTYNFDTQRFPFKSFPAVDNTYLDAMVRKLPMTKDIQGVYLEEPKCFIPRLLISPKRPSDNEIRRMHQKQYQMRPPIYNFKCYAPFPYVLSNNNYALAHLPSSKSGTVRMVLNGGERINGLPMKQELAEAFTEQLPRISVTRSRRPPKTSRKLPVELLVKTSPIVIAEGKPQPVTSDIVAIRILHPTTGKTIYRKSFLPAH